MLDQMLWAAAYAGVYGTAGALTAGIVRAALRPGVRVQQPVQAACEPVIVREIRLHTPISPGTDVVPVITSKEK